jgi:uncharacterized protein
MDQSTALPFTPAAFQRCLSEHKLMGARCTDCGCLHLPPRTICSNCRSSSMKWEDVSPRGRLAAFTAVYICPSFMIEQGFGRDNPYVSGIVELEDGVKISARILELDAKHPETIKIGMPLVLDFIETGEGEEKNVYLAFKPG